MSSDSNHFIRSLGRWLGLLLSSAWLIACGSDSPAASSTDSTPAISAIFPPDVIHCMTSDKCAKSPWRPACADYNNGDNYPKCYGMDEGSGTLGQCVYRAMDDAKCLCVERDLRDCVVEPDNTQGVQICELADQTDPDAGTVWSPCTARL